jgi:hypothetical protein
MTVQRLIAVVSLLAALSIAGCGDDVCDKCEISNQRELCEEVLKDCSGPDCEGRALLACADPI